MFLTYLLHPYINLNVTDYTYNFKEELANKFIKELYIEVQKLDKKGVKWMMTQYNTRYIGFYQKYIYMNY
jgi:hypothetical protein